MHDEAGFGWIVGDWTAPDKHSRRTLYCGYCGSAAQAAAKAAGHVTGDIVCYPSSDMGFTCAGCGAEFRKSGWDREGDGEWTAAPGGSFPPSGWEG